MWSSNVKIDNGQKADPNKQVNKQKKQSSDSYPQGFLWLYVGSRILKMN